MILKLVALFMFMLSVLVAALWVTLELAGAVAEGGDSVWYLAAALAAIAALLILVSLLRTRTRAMVGFMAAAAVILAAVVVTYPDGGPACKPTNAEAQGGGVDTSGSDLGGLLIEEDSTDSTASDTAAADCS